MVLLVLFVCFAVLVVAIMVLEARELGGGSYLEVLGDLPEIGSRVD